MARWALSTANFSLAVCAALISVAVSDVFGFGNRASRAASAAKPAPPGLAWPAFALGAPANVLSNAAISDFPNMKLSIASTVRDSGPLIELKTPAMFPPISMMRLSASAMLLIASVAPPMPFFPAAFDNASTK